MADSPCSAGISGTGEANTCLDKTEQKATWHQKKSSREEPGFDLSGSTFSWVPAAAGLHLRAA